MHGFTVSPHVRAIIKLSYPLQVDRPPYPMRVVLLAVNDDMKQTSRGLKAGRAGCVAIFADRQQLVARMEVALQRAQPRPTSIQVGPLAICTIKRVATWHGDALTLSPREFDILVILAERHGSVVSRDYLFNHLWGLGFAGEGRLIDRHVMKLRQKLGDGGSQLETVWGIGYRLRFGPDGLTPKPTEAKNGAHA